MFSLCQLSLGCSPQKGPKIGEKLKLGHSGRVCWANITQYPPIGLWVFTPLILAMARFICFRSKWYITWYKWLCIQKTIFRRDISLKTKPLQNISFALFIKSITFWLGHRNSLAAVLVCYCQNGYLSTLFNIVKAGCWLKRRTLYKLGQNWTTSNFFSANKL